MRKCKKWTGPNRTSRYARAAPVSSQKPLHAYMHAAVLHNLFKSCMHFSCSYYVLERICPGFHLACDYKLLTL